MKIESDVLEQLCRYGLDALLAEAEQRGFVRGAESRPPDVRIFEKDGSAYIGLGAAGDERNAVTVADFIMALDLSTTEKLSLIQTLRDEMTDADMSLSEELSA